VDMWESGKHPPDSHIYDYTIQVRTVSDSPAGPRLLGDCTEEFMLPMLLTVCFEAGRFT